MFKLLFRVIVPLAFILISALIGYNYFLGTPTEQENSKVIINKVTDLAKDVFNLVHTEKEKYDAGKYDEAISKIKDRLTYLKKQAIAAGAAGKAFLSELERIENDELALEARVDKSSGGTLTSSSSTQGRSAQQSDDSVNIEQIGSEIDSLAADLQRITEKYTRQ